MLGLIVIDMQRWMFRYPERAAQLPSLVANIDALTAKFAEHGLPIFNVQTLHKADRSTWSRLMHKHDYACLIENTADAEFVDGYQPHARAVTVTKTANSAFFGTDLAHLLARTGVTELVLAGVFIDGCVGLTAADAAQHGLEVTLVEDAIGHGREDRRAVILPWLAETYELTVSTTDEVIAALDRQGQRTVRSFHRP
jgi:nicotinamidase-related amidase